MELKMYVRLITLRPEDAEW